MSTIYLRLTYTMKYFLSLLHQENDVILGDNILFHVSELGKKPPTFADSSAIAQEILDSGYEFDVGKIIYNKFLWVIDWFDSVSTTISSCSSVRLWNLDFN